MCKVVWCSSPVGVMLCVSVGCVLVELTCRCDVVC